MLLGAMQVEVSWTSRDFLKVFSDIAMSNVRFLGDSEELLCVCDHTLRHDAACRTSLAERGGRLTYGQQIVGGSCHIAALARWLLSQIRIILLDRADWLILSSFAGDGAKNRSLISKSEIFLPVIHPS